MRSSVQKGEGLVLKNVAINWGPGKPDILSEINLNLSQGSKVGIVGRVGSGKTSLLLSLLGELQFEGEITHPG